MIVKNEAHVIRRCLESVKPWITDWAIVDTGSTDGTQEIIRETLAGTSGTLAERPWVGFATNRNQAIELARASGSEYAFIIDADETLTGNTNYPLPKLDRPGYAIEIKLTGEQCEFWRHLLIRLSNDWHYEGELHEYLNCSATDHSDRIAGVWIESHNDSARNALGFKKKCERDAATLRALLKKEPENRRHQYYLARALAGAGRIDAAIEAYEKRALFDDTGEERWYALYQAAALKEMRGDDWRDVARAYLRAYNERPRRSEPLWALAAIHNDHGEHATAELFGRAACAVPVPPDVQPLNRSIYEWRNPLELAVAISNQGRIEEALGIVRRVEAVKSVPPAELPNIIGLREKLERAVPQAAE